MTVLEDYEAITQQYGTLAAGVTLDPSKPEDKAKLDAALLTSAPGFPGYHDLYMDDLDGPIAWCPDAKDKSPAGCKGTTVPFGGVLLPPGY